MPERNSTGTHRWPWPFRIHVWRYRGYDPDFRRRRWLTPIFGFRFECMDCGKKRWLP